MDNKMDSSSNNKILLLNNKNNNNSSSNKSQHLWTPLTKTIFGTKRQRMVAQASPAKATKATSTQSDSKPNEFIKSFIY